MKGGWSDAVLLLLLVLAAGWSDRKKVRAVDGAVDVSSRAVSSLWETLGGSDQRAGRTEQGSLSATRRRPTTRLRDQANRRRSQKTEASRPCPFLS